MVTAIGWRAHAALAASGGRIEVIAPLSSSFYGTAGGELVWVGPPGSPLHGRAIIAAAGGTGAALLRLADDPALRARIAQGAGVIAAWIAWPALAAETREIYESVFADGAP